MLSIWHFLTVLNHFHVENMSWMWHTSPVWCNTVLMVLYQDTVNYLVGDYLIVLNQHLQSTDEGKRFQSILKTRKRAMSTGFNPWFCSCPRISWIPATPHLYWTLIKVPGTMLVILWPLNHLTSPKPKWLLRALCSLFNTFLKCGDWRVYQFP